MVSALEVRIVGVVEVAVPPVDVVYQFNVLPVVAVADIFAVVPTQNLVFDSSFTIVGLVGNAFTTIFFLSTVTVDPLVIV